MTNLSEVAGLMAKIDAEFQAGQQAIHGFALGTAKHDFINKRMENMCDNLEVLSQQFGEEVAMQAVIAWQDAVAEKSDQCHRTEGNVMSDLLTVSEVARILRVDETTVRRRIKDGVLDAVLLPKSGVRQGYRIKRETLERLLGNQEGEQ